MKTRGCVETNITRSVPVAGRYRRGNCLVLQTRINSLRQVRIAKLYTTAELFQYDSIVLAAAEHTRRFVHTSVSASVGRRDKRRPPPPTQTTHDDASSPASASTSGSHG